MKSILFIALGGKYGSDKSLYTLISNLPSDKYKISIVIRDKIKDSLYNRIDGIQVYNIRFNLDVLPRKKNFKDIILYFSRIIKTIIINRIAIYKLKKIINTISPDIIHTNSSSIQLGYKIAVKYNIPHVWHLREYLNLDFNYTPTFSFNSLIKKINNPINYPIPISEEIKKHFRLKDQYNVIYNGISPNKVERIKILKENFFLYVGAITKEKGIIDLVFTFIEFLKDKKNFKLLIAGSSPDKTLIKYLKNTISNANLENHILFLDYIADINNLMQKAYAIIVSSQNEAFGRVVVEAMVNECLVIGKNNAGIKEQFDNGKKIIGSEIGLRYNSKNELLDILNNLSENGIKKYMPMIKNAKKTSTLLYSQESYVSNVIKVYQNCTKFQN